MNEESNEHTTLLLRLPVALKTRLQREAFAHNRKVTAEINRRLQESLDRYATPGYPLASARALTAMEPGQEAITPMEQAVLDVFRRLPPEKQLALLSLFK